jgi:hypothetical protein
MEEKTQTQLYSELLIIKAKRLNIEPEIKQGIIKMLEYLGKEEGRRLYLVQEFQSEYYLEISNTTLYQTARNYDYSGNPTQKNTAIMLVKDLPEIYLEYQDKIEETCNKGKHF